MKSILTLLMMFLPSLLHAADLRLTISGFSYHKDRDFPYNETNPGFGVGYGTDALFVEAGQYQNSFDRTSKYRVLGASFQVYRCARIGMLLGKINGYTPKYEKFGSPFIQCSYGRLLFSGDAVAAQFVKQFDGVLPW